MSAKLVDLQRYNKMQVYVEVIFKGYLKIFLRALNELSIHFTLHHKKGLFKSSKSCIQYMFGHVSGYGCQN